MVERTESALIFWVKIRIFIMMCTTVLQYPSNYIIILTCFGIGLFLTLGPGRRSDYGVLNFFSKKIWGFEKISRKNMAA